MLIYTGIGSRKTPNDVLEIFVKIGQFLAKHNAILRSGGALGADSAFERGCTLENGKKEIYLPWKNFNNNSSLYFPPSYLAEELAKKFHPAWGRCSRVARLLHARNSHQILGEKLDTPSNFVVCWTTQTGGTQQALRIASFYKIPIYNLIFPEHKKELKNFLKTLAS